MLVGRVYDLDEMFTSYDGRSFMIHDGYQTLFFHDLPVEFGMPSSGMTV